MSHGPIQAISNRSSGTGAWRLLGVTWRRLAVRVTLGTARWRSRNKRPSVLAWHQRAALDAAPAHSAARRWDSVGSPKMPMTNARRGAPASLDGGRHRGVQAMAAMPMALSATSPATADRVPRECMVLLPEDRHLHRVMGSSRAREHVPSNVGFLRRSPRAAKGYSIAARSSQWQMHCLNLRPGL